MAYSYGSICNVPTTGASRITAQGDPLPYDGVPASEHMAQTDLAEMNKYKSSIQYVAQKTGMEAAVIAGIISRESRAGRLLKQGWGDHGNAFGLMQVDKNYHTPCGTWNSVEHITQGVEILIYMFNSISRKFPSWSKDQKLKGALAAYNAGPGSVNSFDQIDSGTTGGDYSNDCTARAKYYKRKGY